MKKQRNDTSMNWLRVSEKGAFSVVDYDVYLDDDRVREQFRLWRKLENKKKIEEKS